MALFPSYNLVKKKEFTRSCFLVTIYQKKNKTLFYESKIPNSGVRLQDKKVLSTHPRLLNDYSNTHKKNNTQIVVSICLDLWLVNMQNTRSIALMQGEITSEFYL